MPVSLRAGNESIKENTQSSRPSEGGARRRARARELLRIEERELEAADARPDRGVRRRPGVAAMLPLTVSVSSHAGDVALVTGANKGLGREIARRLAAEGLVSYLGARDEGRGQVAADEPTRRRRRPLPATRCHQRSRDQRGCRPSKGRETNRLDACEQRRISFSSNSTRWRPRLVESRYARRLPSTSSV